MTFRKRQILFQVLTILKTLYNYSGREGIITKVPQTGMSWLETLL